MKNKFVIGSIVVGAVQIIDALLLISASGNVSDPALWPSLIEFIWAIISIVVLFRSNDRNIKWLAGLFAGYNIMGWVVGAVNTDAILTSGIPAWMVYIGLAFGLIFLTASLLVYRLVGRVK